MAGAALNYVFPSRSIVLLPPCTDVYSLKNKAEYADHHKYQVHQLPALRDGDDRGGAPGSSVDLSAFMQHLGMYDLVIWIHCSTFIVGKKKGHENS